MFNLEMIGCLKRGRQTDRKYRDTDRQKDRKYRERKNV